MQQAKLSGNKEALTKNEAVINGTTDDRSRTPDQRGSEDEKTISVTEASSLVREDLSQDDLCSKLSSASQGLTSATDGCSSPLKIADTLRNPDYLQNIIGAPTSSSSLPMSKILDQASGSQMRLFDDSMEYQLSEPPQRAPQDSKQQTGTGPDGKPYRMKRLYRKHVKVDKDSQVKVLPGTNCAYRTPGAHNRNKRGKIKRPMNAFMCWARSARSYLCQKLPSLKNADVSVKLGQIWADMTPEQKQPYFDEAERIKRQHREEFPDWVYQPGHETRGKTSGETSNTTVSQPISMHSQIDSYLPWKMDPQPDFAPKQLFSTPIKSSPPQQGAQMSMSQMVDGILSGKRPRKLHKNSYDLKIRGTALIIISLQFCSCVCSGFTYIFSVTL